MLKIRDFVTFVRNKELEREENTEDVDIPFTPMNVSIYEIYGHDWTVDTMTMIISQI